MKKKHCTPTRCLGCLVPAEIARRLVRLTKESRAKIITLITIDVHSRDVVQGLIDRRVESNLDFAWQSQLRCGTMLGLGGVPLGLSIRLCHLVYAGSLNNRPKVSLIRLVRRQTH